MTKPRFTPPLIADLNQRVKAHNLSHPEAPTRLQEMKKVYQRHYRGQAPGVAAMGAVEGHLDALAKAAGGDNFDESKIRRDGDGQFAPKGGGAKGPRPRPLPETLPKSRAEHEATARENAGYAALTTDIIPETRMEQGGIMLRDAGVLAGGIGLTASLARAKENGLTARAARFAGRQTGGLAAGLAAAIAGKGGAKAAEQIDKLRGTDTPIRRAARNAAAKRRTRAAAAAGASVGDKAGRLAADGAGRLIRLVADAAAAGGSTPRRAAVRRAAAIAVMGLPTAAALRESIKGTPFDPQVIGWGMDAFSSRRVGKVLGGDDLAKIEGEMLAHLRNGGSFDTLAKAGLSGAYSTVGRGVLTGIAAAAGGLAAGGAVSGGQRIASAIGGGRRGNPYRDEDGKFTSKERARSTLWTPAAAVAGAVAAGAGAAVALRRHNVRLLGQAMTQARSAYQRRVADIDTGSGRARVQTMVQNRDTLVDEAVRKHPDYVRGEAEMKSFAGASPLHFKSRVAKEVDDKIGELAVTGWDNFLVAGTIPKTIAELKALPAAKGAAGKAAIAKKVSEFVGKASKDEFQAAIKGMTPEQKKTATDWFNNRQKWVNEVDDLLAGHRANVTAAEDGVKAAREATQAAARAESDAKAVFDRTRGAKELEAVEPAWLDAQKATREATRAQKAAEKVLAELQDNGPPIKSPATGAVIPPASSMELNASFNEVVGKIRAKAQTTLDDQIKGARAAQRVDAAEWSNRRIAAIAVLGRGKGLSRSQERLRRSLVSNGRALREQQRAVDAARREVDLARGAKGMPASEKKARVTAAEAALRTETKNLDDGRRVRARLASEFEAAVLAQPGGKGFRVLPEGMAQDLRDDLKRAYGTMDEATRAFIQRPTMQRLINFADKQARGVKQRVTETGHTLFYKPDGKGGLTPSWVKIGTAVPTITAAGHGAVEFGNWAWDAAMGAPDKKAKARAKSPPGLHLDRRVDATTGAAYAALTTAHPTEKGERIILYGERQDGYDGVSKPIFAGGKLSQIDSAFREGRLGQQQNRQGGGDNQGGGGATTGRLADLSDKQKADFAEKIKLIQNGDFIFQQVPGADGVSVSYLKQGGNGAASAPFWDYMRDRFIGDNKSRPTGQSYHDAVNALFSNEGKALTARTKARMLLGYDEAGKPLNRSKGIFAEAEGFKSPDANRVAKALADEIGRVLPNANTPEQQANLHRAVHVVQVARGLSDDAVKPIHAQIAGARKTTGQTAAKSAPRPPSNGPSVRSLMTGKPLEPPDTWDPDDLDNLTEVAASKLRQGLGTASRYEDAYRPWLREAAIAVHRAHGLEMRTALDAAREASLSYAGTDPAMRASVSEHIRSGDAPANRDMQDLLDEWARKLGKGLGLDDLDGLMKSFERPWDETKYRRHGRGSDQGGEFAPKGGGAAAPSSASRAPRQPRAPRPPPEAMGDLHPVKAAGEIGSLAGMTAAWQVAGKLLPAGMKAAPKLAADAAAKAGGAGLQRSAMSVVRNFLPAPARVAGVGIQMVASAAGMAAGEFGGDAAARAAYRMAGKTVPRDQQPGPMGRDLADAGGQIVGGALGGIAGAFGGPAAFAGSVGGAWAGGVAARHIHDWFTGYDPTKVSRAMRNFTGGDVRR